jgi:rSAM/selenodomain-associated transferase 1
VSTRDAVLVFVRAPELGRVKTRLAAAVGEDAALDLYRRMGRLVVDAALRLGSRTTIRVHHTPTGRRDSVASWLGEDLTYLPQRGEDLGERMEDAFAEAFAAGHSRVVVVGSDLPDLTDDLLRRALDLLGEHDAVIGPARDGGYWLLGLRAPAPHLFTGMPWSTAEVYDLTVSRLRAAGIEPAVLPELTDVDEADDLPPDWLAGVAQE